MREFLIKLWPFTAIFFAAAVFFYPVFLQGKIPLPADFTVGTYYPWLDYKWAGYGAGVPVKNPITTDVVSFTYPIQMHTIDLIKKGVLPLWNNLILSGTPLLADFQSAPFSPTNFFYLFFPKLLAWTLQIIAQPLLAAVFLYLLLRNFGLSKLSSVTGGLFYAFAGFMTIWMEWNGHSLVAAMFPLVILFSKKLLESGKFLWGSLLSITLALQIFSGYPQIILYEFLTIFLLVLVFDRDLLKDIRKIFKLSLFLTLGVGLAAVQILPGLELLRWSQRSTETVLNEWAFLPPQLLITFLAPDYFGNHATQNYWGPADYTLTTGFSGVVIITLALIGFLTDRKNKAILFGVLLVVLSLVIVLPNPISVWFKESGFLGLQAASAHRGLVLSNLGFAILAAFGLDALFQKRIGWKESLRAFYIPGILLLSFAAGTYFAMSWLKIQPNGEELATRTIVNLTVGLKNLILPIMILSTTAILIGLNFYLKRFNKIFIGILIVVGLFELFRFGWKFMPFSEKEFVFPETPVLSFLQNQQKPFRVTAEDVVPINMMMPYGIETVEGYDAVYPLKFAKYLAVLNSSNIDATSMGRYGSVSNIDSRFFDLVNGKYVLVLKRDNRGTPDAEGQIPEKFQTQKLKPVFEDKTVVVLENTAVYPRAFFVSDWESESDSQKVLANLSSSDFPLNQRIILEENFNGFPQSPQNNSQVKFSGNLEENIEVRTENPGFLFISDNFYPGWKANVDGVETKIYLANYTFQAIPIDKPGIHIVKLSYTPQSFKLGIVISLISLVVLGMIGGLQLKYGKELG